MKNRIRQNNPSGQRAGRRSEGSGSLLGLVLTGILLASCSGGGGGGGDGVSVGVLPGSSDPRTLEGRVLAPSGAGVVGATVTVCGLATQTDAGGNFLLSNPMPGAGEVEIDGTTASSPGSFPLLEIPVDVAAVGNSSLRIVVLPDLSLPISAIGAVTVDAFGAAVQPIDALSPMPGLSLGGPAGTLITIDGAAATGSVDFNVTPVDPGDVPMPLESPGQSLDAASFVTIQPGRAAFDADPVQPGAQGLDATFPNTRGFAAGTQLDVWSFDRDAGAWVNRSSETGEFGVVDPTGTFVFARGVITKGGWHAPAAPLNAGCASAVVGRVVSPGGTPLPDVSVALSSGQFATSALDGTFSIPEVAAFDVSAMTGCAAIDLDIDLHSPVVLGSTEAAVQVDAASLAPGGINDVGDLVLDVATAGHVAGLMTDNGSGMSGVEVRLLGPTPTTLMTSSSGTFFATSLQPGFYTAEATFLGDSEPTSSRAFVSANGATSITLQRTAGMGSTSLEVRVVYDDDGDLENAPLAGAGARVLLVGSDAGSLNGISGVADASGRIVFDDVDGPFTVSAQMDLILPGSNRSARLASTLVDVTPLDGVIGIPILAIEESGPSALDATLQGTVTSVVPPLASGESLWIVVRARGPEDGFSDAVQVDSVSGLYSLLVPSEEVLDVMLQRRDSDPLGGTLQAAMLVPGIGPAAAGATLTRDFNYSSTSRIDFTIPATFFIWSAIPKANEQSIVLTLTRATGARFDLELFSGPGAYPDPILTPAETEPGLGGYEAAIGMDQERTLASGEVQSLDCTEYVFVQLSSQVFTASGAPVSNGLLAGDELALPQAESMRVDFTQGLSGNTQGLNLVELAASGETGLGLDTMAWTVFIPKDRTAFDLPATVVPMFASGSDYTLEISQFRYFGDFFYDYETTFGASVAQRLAEISFGIDVECTDSTLIPFSVQ